MRNTLREIDGIPLPDHSLLTNVSNRLINEELNYNIIELKTMHEQLCVGMNTCGKKSYEAIIDLVSHEKGKLIFVHGHGGIGKTYLWKTIITKLMLESRIVLTIATSR